MSINVQQKRDIVTDLDCPDSHNMNKKTQSAPKKRPKRKILQTLSGNFNCRSQSADCVSKKDLGNVTSEGRFIQMNNSFSELLQSKDEKVDALIQRLTTVHKFNEQFAEENQRLLNEVKNLKQQLELLQRQISDCKKCHRLEKESSMKTDEINLLNADVEMMKTLTYRLNIQIERYQDILRDKSKTKPSILSNDFESSLLQWPKGKMRIHTLAPLLQAYDEMLQEKTELVQQYSKQFEEFTGELKQIVEENNCLQEEVERLRREYGNWREEKARLQAQANISHQKAEVQTKKTDLAKEKLVEVMHCYEQKIQTFVLDMEHLQTAYTRCKSELASLKSVSHLPQDSNAQSLQECKDFLEQLKKQHSVEKNEMERTIKDLKNVNDLMQNQMNHFKSENDALQQQLRQLKALNYDIRNQYVVLQGTCEKLKHSRSSLKTRLRMALQWAHKLEENQSNLETTWNTLKRFETIVKHKESQVRGLQARHLQEIDKLEKKLAAKEETIKTILRDKLSFNTS